MSETGSTLSWFSGYPQAYISHIKLGALPLHTLFFIFSLYFIKVFEGSKNMVSLKPELPILCVVVAKKCLNLHRGLNLGPHNFEADADL